MTRIEEEKVRASLAAAIDRWWDSEGGAQSLDVRMPFVGNATFELMAMAATTVLLALDDAQRCMIDGGIVKADDF
jgi:hypothetical protein